MKIYCVIRNEVWDGEDWQTISVYRNRKDAQARVKIERDKCFNDWCDEDVITDTEDEFFAYRDGEYCLYHCVITIEETELI